MIRITGGTFRSRKLITPDTLDTKPTMDRVREGVFNALSFDIKDSKVLDLFAGSGSYGFESLSRGAKEVTFIDNSPLAISSLKENAKALGVINQVKILGIDSLSYINNIDEPYNIIFIDPPYKLYDYNSLIDDIYNSKLVNDNTILVVESDNDLTFDEAKYKKIKKYKYSLAKIYILRK